MSIIHMDFTVNNLNSSITVNDCLHISVDEKAPWCEAFREIGSKKIPIYTVNSETIGKWSPEKNLDFVKIKKGIETMENRIKEKPLSEKIQWMQEYCDLKSSVEKNPLTWGLYTENLDYQSYKHQINSPAILLCPENIIRSIQGKRMVDDLQEILALVLAHECAHYYLDTPEKTTLLSRLGKVNQNEKELVQAVMEESLANAVAYSCYWEKPEKFLDLLSLQAINYRLAIRWLKGSLLNPWFICVLQDWRGEGYEENKENRKIEGWYTPPVMRNEAFQENRKGLLKTLLAEPIDPYNTPVGNELRYWPFLVKALLYTCADLDSGFQIILKSSSADQAMIKDLEGPSTLNELFRIMRAFYQDGEEEALNEQLFNLHIQYGLEVDSKTMIHELNQLRLLNL